MYPLSICGMYVWELSQKSDLQKMFKFEVIMQLMLFFSNFLYSDSHFVTYKAFIKP